MIVDCHTHVWLPEHLGPPFVDEVRGPGGRPPDLTADPVAHRAGTAEADAVCVFAFEAPRVGVSVPNELVAEYVRTDPERLIGYASLDPTEPGAVAVLDRAYLLGLRGLKLPATYQGWHPLDERAFPVYERAQELGMPVTFHLGTTPHPSAPLEYARPIHVDELARTFPRLRVVIAHVAHPWEAEALVVCRKHPHVYADVSGLHYRPFQLYHTLRLAVEYAVDGKLLFGSDFPWLTTAQAAAGLRHVAAEARGERWPVPEEVVEGIVNRDSLSLLGLATP